jgi:hypothetical protein
VPPGSGSRLRRLLRGRPASWLVVGGVLAVGAGCAPQKEGRSLPVGCELGQESVTDALRAAPRPVRLDGVPLSACFDPTSEGTDLQSVGVTFVGAAGTLAERARKRPEGPAATQLGYLIGAMRKGAGGVETQGIHTELVRRVEQELSLVDPDSRALREGVEAGERTG